MRRFALAALIACWTGLQAALPAWAAQGDRTRPVNIESESGGQLNLQTRRLEFSGKVLLTQGTLQMRSRRMEVLQRPDSSTLAMAIGEPGEPVRFEQGRDQPSERITGQAERIEYDNSTEVARFVGGATVRRMVGNQVADEVTGAVIVYNSRNETFTVEAGQTAQQAGGRTRVMLMPRQPSDAASAPDAAAPPAPAASVALQLSPALSSGPGPVPGPGAGSVGGPKPPKPAKPAASR